MKTILSIIFSVTVIFGQVNNKTDFSVKTNFKENDSKKVIEVKVFDGKGELLYKINKALTSKETAPHPVLLDNAGVVLVDVLAGNAEFYNPEGNKISTATLFGKIPFAYERTVFSDPDNGVVAFLISQHNLKNSIVKIYNNSGALLNEFKVTGTYGSGIKIFKDKNLVAVSTYYWDVNNLKRITGIFDLSGNPVFEVNQKFDEGSFSQNGNYFLGYDKHKIFLLDLTNKKVMWERNFGKDEYILTAAFNNNEIVSVTSTDAELKNGIWYNKIAVVRQSKLNGSDELLSVLNEREFQHAQLIFENDKIKVLLDDKPVFIE